MRKLSRGESMFCSITADSILARTLSRKNRLVRELRAELLLQFFVAYQRGPWRLGSVQDPPDDLYVQRLAGAGLVGVDDAAGVGIVDEMVDQDAGQGHRECV